MCFYLYEYPTPANNSSALTRGRMHGGGCKYKIGSGWQSAHQTIEAGDGNLLVIHKNKNAYHYRDTARNGTSSWQGSRWSRKIGSGWNAKDIIFVDNGSRTAQRFYYIDKRTGVLCFYQNLTPNMTSKWRGSRCSQKIGGGFGKFKKVLYAGRLTPRGESLLAIKRDGTMCHYINKDFAGSGQWLGSNCSIRLGGGWNKFRTLLSGSNGKIYGVKHNGDMCLYKLAIRRGTIGHPLWQGKNCSMKIATQWNARDIVFGGSVNRVN